MPESKTRNKAKTGQKKKNKVGRELEEMVERIERTLAPDQFSCCDDLLNAFSNNQPLDLIFLDFRMGKIDGISCLKSIKSNPAYASKPVLFFAGDTFEKSIDLAFEMGAYYFVSKPNDYFEYTKILGDIIKSQNWREPLPRPGRENFVRTG